MKEKLFSEILKQKRFELKLSQIQMAKALGISKNMYGLYESGKYDHTTSVRREEYMFKLSNLKSPNKEQESTNRPQEVLPITDSIVSDDEAKEYIQSLETVIKHKDKRINALQTENEILQEKIRGLTTRRKINNDH